MINISLATYFVLFEPYPTNFQCALVLNAVYQLQTDQVDIES